MIKCDTILANDVIEEFSSRSDKTIWEFIVDRIEGTIANTITRGKVESSLCDITHFVFGYIDAPKCGVYFIGDKSGITRVETDFDTISDFDNFIIMNLEEYIKIDNIRALPEVYLL